MGTNGDLADMLRVTEKLDKLKRKNQEIAVEKKDKVLKWMLWENYC